MNQKQGRLTADAESDDFLNLTELYETKRAEALRNMEVLNGARRQALIQLRTIHALFKNLNRKQQAFINACCVVNYTPKKIAAISEFPSFAEYPDFGGVPQFPSGIRQKQIKTIRKNILQLGVIQARAEELFKAIVKSAAVFNRQYKTACRELFPLGFISRLWRSLKRFFSHPYFSWQEMGCLQNLGTAAGFVLKIAETPVLGGR